MVTLCAVCELAILLQKKKQCSPEGSIKYPTTFKLALLGSLRLAQGLNSEPSEFMLTKAGLKAQSDVCF